MGHSAHLARDPGGEDLAALLFAEARAREVAAVDEGDNVDYDLMFIKDGVDNYGDDGGEVGLAANFDEDDYEAAGLEDSAVVLLATCVGRKEIHLPAACHNVSVAILDRVLDVHREVTETVNLKGLSNTTQNEEDLHVDLCSIGANGPADIMQEAKISGTDILDIHITIRQAAIESLGVKHVFGAIK